MAATNYELAARYLHHSDPILTLQIWEDTSITSSVVCLVDSALSANRSLSCHTLRQIYHPLPRYDFNSDLSLASDSMKRRGVVRTHHDRRPSCALPLSYNQKTLSVSKTAQDLIREFLENDPSSNPESAVYTKRRTKVHKISTSSITIDDSDLYCCGNSSEPCSGCSNADQPPIIPSGNTRADEPHCACPDPKTKEGAPAYLPPVNRPAASDVPQNTAPSTGEVQGDPCLKTAELNQKSESTEPPIAITSKYNRPRHIHCRPGRPKCHAHSWVSSSSTNAKDRTASLSNAIASKLQQFVDSGARLVGYVPLERTKFECEKSIRNKEIATDTSIKHAEKSAPCLQVSETRTDATIEIHSEPCSLQTVNSQGLPTDKNCIPQSFSNNLETHETIEWFEKSNNNVPTCPGCRVKTLDISSLASDTLSSKCTCRCHSTNESIGAPPTSAGGASPEVSMPQAPEKPLTHPEAVPCEVEKCPGACSVNAYKTQSLASQPKEEELLHKPMTKDPTNHVVQAEVKVENSFIGSKSKVSCRCSEHEQIPYTASNAKPMALPETVRSRSAFNVNACEAHIPASPSKEGSWISKCKALIPLTNSVSSKFKALSKEGSLISKAKKLISRTSSVSSNVEAKVSCCSAPERLSSTQSNAMVCPGPEICPKPSEPNSATQSIPSCPGPDISKFSTPSCESCKVHQSQPQISTSQIKTELQISKSPCSVCPSCHPQIQEPHRTGSYTSESHGSTSSSHHEDEKKRKVGSPRYSDTQVSVGSDSKTVESTHSINSDDIIKCPGPTKCKGNLKKCPPGCSTSSHSHKPKSQSKENTKVKCECASASENQKKHEKKHHPLKKKGSAGSGSSDSSILQHESKKRSAGSLSEKSELTRANGISSVPAKYKMSGIKLQLIKFPDSSADSCIEGQMSDQGLKKGESKTASVNTSKSVDARPQRCCCPCPSSIRSGFAAANNQQRTVGTEFEPYKLCSKSSEKTSNPHSTSGRSSGKLAKSESQPKHSSSTGQKQALDDAQGDASNASENKCLISEELDSIDEKSKKIKNENKTAGPKRSPKNKKREQKYETSEKHKKTLADYWPCSLCMGHSKKEASVGDEYRATDHKGVNVSPDEANPMANETHALRCEIKQQQAKCPITTQISTKSCCFNVSNDNKNLFMNDCAKLGCKQPQVSKSTSMICYAKTFSPAKDSIVKANHSTSMLPPNPYCYSQSAYYDQDRPASMQTCSNPCCPFLSAGWNRNHAPSVKSCTTSTYLFQDTQSINNQTSALSCSNQFQDSAIRTSRATSVINFANISYPLHDSEVIKSREASIVSCPSPSYPIEDSGIAKNQATSISKSSAEILGAFQDSEMNKSQATSFVLSKTTKSCGYSSSILQNLEMNKIQSSSNKHCANPVCPFESSLMTNKNQINIRNTSHHYRELPINNQLAMDNSSRPNERLPTCGQSTEMQSSCCQSCCTNNSIRIHPCSTSNTQHLCCCNNCSQTNKQITSNSENSNGSVKDSVKMADQNTITSSIDMKSSSNDSLAQNNKKESLFETDARNEATQYSVTVVNNLHKEIVVQRSLSHPNFCRCATNRILNNKSAPKVNKSMSQPLVMSVVSTELTPSPCCKYCAGQTTPQKSIKQVDNSHDPLPAPPRPAVQDAEVSVHKQKQRSVPSYTQTEPSKPKSPPSSANFDQTCNPVNHRDTGVKSTEYANKYKMRSAEPSKKARSSENINQESHITKQNEPEKKNTSEPIHTDRQSGPSGVKFAIIQRDSKPNDYIAQQDYYIPSASSSVSHSDGKDCDTALQVAQGYALCQKHFCQQYPCPGKDCCTGPPLMKTLSHSPSGNLTAREVSQKRKKKEKPSKAEDPPKSLKTPELRCCDVCLRNQSSSSSNSKAKKPKRAKQLKGTEVPCASICQIKARPCDLPCGNICYRELTNKGSSCHSVVSIECCSATCSTESSEPRKQKKKKVSPCLSICDMNPLKKKSKQSKVHEVPERPCRKMCLQRLAGHGVGLRVSVSGSNSCNCSEPHPKQKIKQKSSFLHRYISLSKISSSRQITSGKDSATSVTKEKKRKPPKQPKKSISPAISDFPCGNKCFRKLASSSGASSSGIYIMSRPYLSQDVKNKPGKSPKATKAPKSPTVKDFPCGKICLQKLKSNSSSSSAGKKGKRGKTSAFSSNSLCMQVTSCGSSFNSAHSTKSKVGREAKSTNKFKSANTPRTVEVFYERLPHCCSTSSSAVSRSSSNTNAPNSAEPAKPTEATDKQKLPKAADFSSENVCLQKITPRDNTHTARVSRRAGADGTVRSTKEAKPTRQANELKVAVFSSNSICFQVTPCGSEFSTNSKSSSRANVEKQSKPTKVSKDSKQLKKLKASDFPCGDICMQKLTPSSSGSSLTKQAKSSKPSKSSKQPKSEDFPCGNICLQKATPSTSENSLEKSKSSGKTTIKQAKTSKQSKSSKQPIMTKQLKAQDFPCGNVCMQKLTPSASETSLANTKGSRTAIKPAKSSKKAKQPKAQDFPCGNVCSEKVTPSASEASLAKSKRSSKNDGATNKAKSSKRAKENPPKVTDYPCGDICSQKITTPAGSESTLVKPKSSTTKAVNQTPTDSASNSPKSSKTKVAKQPKPVKQQKATDFPCGNICMRKLTPSYSVSSVASKSSSKTKSVNSPKSAKPPKSSNLPRGTVDSQAPTPRGSTSSLAKSSKMNVANQSKNKNELTSSASSTVINGKNSEKVFLPCGSVCSQTGPVPSVTKLKKIKPLKPPKSGKGPKSVCTCPASMPPCQNTSSVTNSAKSPKTMKAGKGAKSPCSCISTLPPNASLSSVTNIAQPTKPPKSRKALKESKSVCNCGSTASASKVKSSNPQKSPKPDKKGKSPCDCPPRITPCASSVAKPPKSSKAGKGKKTPATTNASSEKTIAKSPKSPKGNKKSKSQCNCPPTLTPCASSSSITKSGKPPKSSKTPITAKGSKSVCSCPPNLTPCGSASSVNKTAKSPKSPKTDKRGKSPCSCPPSLTPCVSTSSVTKTGKSSKSPKALTPIGSSQIPPRPKTPVKLMKSNNYKGNRNGVITLEEYEKNKKKKKKSKLLNTDVCLPICEAECNITDIDNTKKQQKSVIDCVAVPDNDKKRGKWLGIFPCKLLCAAKRNPMPSPKDGKQYVDCSVTSLAGLPKSRKTVIPCECPATERTQKQNYIECSFRSLCQLSKSQKKSMTCECPDTSDTGTTTKLKGRKVGPDDPGDEAWWNRTPCEAPVNQGLKVQIRKKMCPLFTKA